MNLSYFGRLACLSLAAFFLAHAILAAGFGLVSRRAVRRAMQMRPESGARFLLGLRLLPATTAAWLVAALCIPSYFLLEPKQDAEQIGPVAQIAALLGAAICISGVARGALAAIRSSRYLRQSRQGNAPVVFLAGVFRQRLIVSTVVRKALTAAEFEAALRHEKAHQSSRDNLKRLLILMSPDVLPWLHGFRALDAAWQRLAEWAADDRAVEDSSERALALASALVRVGRMRARAAIPPLCTSLVPDAGSVSERVERLIEGRRGDQPLPRLLWPAAACILALSAGSALAPATRQAVHELLESLAH